MVLNEEDIVKKYIRGMVLAACILFCAKIFLGCGEVKTSEQTDKAMQADSANQAEEDETLFYEQVEENVIGYANTWGSRITYEDGCYYYASQLDNYFLYRAKEDGSEPVCLAKVHTGTILVDKEVIYFVNLSDNNAIYRIGTDGSDMRKVCDNKFNSIEMSAEYIYYRDSYDREADIRGLISESEAKAMEEGGSHVFYRIRKDGSGKEILFKDTSYYTIADADSGEVMYDGYLYHRSTRWNKEIEHNETIITRYDLDGENKEDICRFDFGGHFILVCGDRIYCFGDSDDNDRGKIGVYTIGEKGMKYLPDKTLTDRCIYDGVLYGLEETKDETSRSTKVYRLEDGATQWEEIYRNDAECIVSSGYYYEGNLTDIYATEQGVFFRQFVSPEEGVKWFSLGKDGNVVRWEDENKIPIAKPAAKMEHTYDSGSIKAEFKSTDGYEEYLVDDLAYEEFYKEDGQGEGLNPYRIRLPQFNEKIGGYQEINSYFQNVYQEALSYKRVFFDMLDEENGKDEYGSPNTMLHEGVDYDYVYIGEKYITVAKYKYKYGYWYDVSDWQREEPVTFERQTGRVVSLEEFFGDSTEEAIARATASIYKYMENGDGYGAKFFLSGGDILTKEFDPNQFFLFPEGIGLYYEKHSIDLYTVDFRITEDYLFLVPYYE